MEKLRSRISNSQFIPSTFHLLVCTGYCPQDRTSVSLWTWNTNQGDRITLVAMKYMWQLMVKTTKNIPSWKVLWNAIFQDGRWILKLISAPFYWCPNISLSQPNGFAVETAIPHCSTRRYLAATCPGAYHVLIFTASGQRWISSSSPQREWLLTCWNR